MAPPPPPRGKMERLLSWHSVYSHRSKKQRGSSTVHISVQSSLTYFQSALMKRDLAITFIHAQDVTLIDHVKKYSLSSLHRKIVFLQMGDYCTSPRGTMEITLSILYKGQSIWDGRQNFEKMKGQDLALSYILRDKKAPFS